MAIYEVIAPGSFNDIGEYVVTVTKNADKLWSQRRKQKTEQFDDYNYLLSLCALKIYSRILKGSLKAKSEYIEEEQEGFDTGHRK